VTDVKPEVRRQLGLHQQQLVRALILGGPVPAGFDASRVEVTARQLVEKRWCRVGDLRPALHRSLGPTGSARFFSYASAFPLPAGGAEADALCFCQKAVPAGELSFEARIEHAAARARYRSPGGGLVPRHGPFVTRVACPVTRRSVLMVRMPILGQFRLGRAGR